MTQSAANPKKEGDDDNNKKPSNLQKRALGFFGRARLQSGDPNTDW